MAKWPLSSPLRRAELLQPFTAFLTFAPLLIQIGVPSQCEHQKEDAYDP